MSCNLSIATRYLMSHSGKKGHLGNTLAIAGLSIGIMTLITVLSVMNGFQQGYISSINEIYSYHIRIENHGHDRYSIERSLSSIPVVNTVIPFLDFQGMLTSSTGFTSGVKLRLLDFEIIESDEGFQNNFGLKYGSLNALDGQGILLGLDLARAINSTIGDNVTLTYFDSSNENTSLNHKNYVVTGIFKTGYPEYDGNLVFSAIRSSSLDFKDSSIIIGVKLKNHFKDQNAISSILENTDIEFNNIVSWREYNRTFFTALKIEKLLMLLVVGFVFLIVAVNIYQSMKRSVRERLVELALLKSLGSKPVDIILIFILQGLIIGLSGCALGTILGITISLNINRIMGSLSNILELIGNLSRSFSQDKSGFSGISITDFPTVLMIQDLVIVNSLALISVILASWRSIYRSANISPSTILSDQ